ncbi:nidogen-like domain-containing protein [Wenxinia marina]|uniref:NIDO domain-containing protein n=1 Tax=Wenxinia marina DSM 24838 TaxID=1123501 RepID=A0A0D0NT99_9RHOB|nr:nidogen-like domain-containing protein [Wenxinia marina]KIQ71425.1 hypothetical protein Wenmar_04071 [Wenxinia marina DSM 24838]GGL78910.1 hypothetical protein GCM10011392_36730 [Wenxinia marina]
MDLINTLGGEVGFGENRMEPTDDGNSGRIDLSEVFPDGLNFFGAVHDGLWINANGNVTFERGFSQFWPQGLSTLEVAGIFPFWTDIDPSDRIPVTASPGGTSQGTNSVWWDLDAGAGTFTVTWDDVVPFGYYGQLGEEVPVNAFQMTITDIGGEAGQAPGDFRVDLRYEAIEWTDDARIGFIAGDGSGAYGTLGASGSDAALRLLPQAGPISFTSDGSGLVGFDLTRPIRDEDGDGTILGTDGADAIEAQGASGRVVIRSGLGEDVIQLRERFFGWSDDDGGERVLTGTAEEHFGDTVLGALRGDTILFEDVAFTREDITVYKGTQTAGLDLDGDGVDEGTMRVDARLRDSELLVTRLGDDTIVNFAPALPDLEEGVEQYVGRGNAGFARAYLTGDGTTAFRVTERDLGDAGAAPALGVYEIDGGGALIDARILFAPLEAREGGGAPRETVVDGVEAGHRLGFFLLETEADLPVGGDSADRFEFVNQLGEAATLEDGNYVLPALDGAVIRAGLVHGDGADLNRDLQVHAVAGLESGGGAITFAFEATLFDGDRDFNDLALEVMRIEAEAI